MRHKVIYHWNWICIFFTILLNIWIVPLKCRPAFLQVMLNVHHELYLPTLQPSTSIYLCYLRKSLHLYEFNEEGILANSFTVLWKQKSGPMWSQRHSCHSVSKRLIKWKFSALLNIWGPEIDWHWGEFTHWPWRSHCTSLNMLSSS